MNTPRLLIPSAAMALGAWLAWPAALAQAPVDLAPAQAAYERSIAACNSAGLPAPQRDACVREAGATLDRAHGTPPVPVQATTSDGRATVMTPAPVQTTPSAGATTEIRTSSDGRATIVVPTDGAVRGTAPQ